MNKQQFSSWVHRFCIPTGLILLLLMVSYPFIVGFVYGIWPDWPQLIPAFVSLTLMMLPWWPSEYFGYMSTMGPGALYMSYLTGNVTNLRMPATVGTINSLGIEPNTDECHTMAIIACGASNLTTTVIILIGLVLSVPLEPILTAPELQPSFNMALPALFGGLCAQTLLKKSRQEWAMWLIPLAATLFFTYVVPINSAYMMLIATLTGAVVWYFGKYKLDAARAGRK